MRRRILDIVMWSLFGVALALVVLPAIDIIVGILAQSAGSWSPELLFTPTSGVAGGLLNAWTGTLMLMALLLIMAAPIGVLGGIYLAEFGSQRLAQILRFGSETLAGVPSIIVGYVIYLVFVVKFGWSFSALAGGIALTIMVIPYIMRSTEAALRQVPTNLREGGTALGLPPSLTIRRVLLPMALPNIMTGLVVAEAIAMGETAPLIYTAGWSNSLPTAQLIHQPIGYLTYVVWTYINQPFSQAHQLAYSAAALLLVLLLLLIGLGRLISARASRFNDRFQV
ncbi:MAG: phosphate ABC transporter permease PstA [Chloroflexi bacterium]|nr:phosphate ABC transporter permease PstA [Chloroflexota bacterium]